MLCAGAVFGENFEGKSKLALKMPEIEVSQQSSSGSTGEPSISSSSSDSGESSCDIDGHVLSSGIQPGTTDLGKRVVFYSEKDKKEKHGVLRFFGVPEFAEGKWCGVELDGPQGKNNGSIQGIRYFSCETNCGVFVLASKVELDNTNRKPKPRPLSTGDKARKNSSTGKMVFTNGLKSSSTPLVHQEMVQRMVHGQSSVADKLTKRKNSQPNLASRRQPMKAFAPRGMNRDDVIPRHSKAVFVPFGTGGMHKAVSMENVRAGKVKEQGHQVGGPVKKSSSERDLRGTGTSKLADKTTTVVAKPRKKQGRASSVSEINAVNEKSTGRGENEGEKRYSVDLSDTSKNATRVVNHWPKTSTPGNSRDDSSPDGCSSPDEDSEIHLTSRESSPECDYKVPGETLPCPTPQDTSTTSVDKAFVNTPTEPPTPFNAHHRMSLPDLPRSPDLHLRAPMGLTTQTSQFVDSEKSLKAVGHCRVPSPESVHTKPRYQNRPSGTATLSHPLTQATNAPENGVNGEQEEEEESSTTSRLSNGTYTLVDKTTSTAVEASQLQLGGVSLSQLAEVLTCCAELKERVVSLEKRVAEVEHSHRAEVNHLNTKFQEVQAARQEQVAKLEQGHRAELRAASTNHHHELIALQKAHKYSLEEVRKEFERHTAV